jgi:maltose alpha-D-glucosyltransferase/alpha-amylase
VRKAHPAFARGTVEFLDALDAGRPDEGLPEVLAYLRSYDGRTVLSINNLSANGLRIQLDLAGYAGTQPRDLFGGERLPAIGDAPYSFELQRYEYRWLQLTD